ncbi:uncharacterized protein LOC109806186 [Cajanus cajan]|uniref:uncharacterized protein LOC109806186 n=1 Tax=Cajanus cajan TaxID=3821 RepID=UPI00098DD5DB|nr:uncharacterized protein LOC109806186 [Cajanus cajan]
MSGGQSGVATLRCYRCGGPHFIRDFPHIESKCFRCGQMGHMSTSCPVGARQTKSAPRGDRSIAAGRVFALTGAAASTSFDLVKGKGKTTDVGTNGGVLVDDLDIPPIEEDELIGLAVVGDVNAINKNEDNMDDDCQEEIYALLID